MPEILAIANQKGGVGKTTTAVNLAACLAASERRTLLIDMDPQGNATSGLGLDKNAVPHTTYDLLLNETSFNDVVQETQIENLHCLPANISLIGAEVELIDAPLRNDRLRDRLGDSLDGYDYCIIDAPPSLGLLTLNALCAANGVLIPVQCEYYALEGLSLLLETIERVQASLDREFSIAGILLTMFDRRTNLSNQVADEIRSHFPEQVYSTVIPRSIRLSEAPSFGQPIILYDFRSTGSQSYISLCQEIINGREEESAGPGAGSVDSHNGPEAEIDSEPAVDSHGDSDLTDRSEP